MRMLELGAAQSAGKVKKSGIEAGFGSRRCMKQGNSPQQHEQNQQVVQNGAG